MSLTTLDRQFNEVVCVDHFFLDDLVMFHIMDSATRYSCASVVSNTNLNDAISSFEMLWLGHFWPSQFIHGDGSFQQPQFRGFLARYDISLRPVRPRRHQKNMIEPKHGSIRAIFLRLRQFDPTQSPHLCALEAVRISNDLYGNYVASSYELAKGFTRPIVKCEHVNPLPPELVEAHVDLLARRKLHLIMRTNVSPTQSFKVGDLIEIYIKRDPCKRGRWTSPRIVTSVDRDAGFVTVPGKNGKFVNAAFEDARLSLDEHSFAHSIKSAIDVVDNAISDTIDNDPIDHYDHVSRTMKILSAVMWYINSRWMMMEA